MKSLEIVNEMVDYWESAVNVACKSNAENGYYDEWDIVEYQNRLKKYQQIKADLEVLEILRKHYKDIKVRPRLSNMKDLQKLKKWLEENE